jgi:hypothetical protein
VTDHVLALYDEIIDDVKARARAWRDQEMDFRRWRHDDVAERCRVRAANMEQFAVELTARRDLYLSSGEPPTEAPCRDRLLPSSVVVGDDPLFVSSGGAH